MEPTHSVKPKFNTTTFRKPPRRSCTTVLDDSLRGNLIKSLIENSKNSIKEEDIVVHYKNDKYGIKEKTGGFQEYYTEFKTIGQGSSSVVKLCQDIESKILYAVKILRTNEEEIVNQAKNEFFNLIQFNCDYIIKAYELFHDQSKHTMHLVLEYPENCENLFDLVKNNGPLIEQEAKWIFRAVLKGIYTMHKAGLCHRDIKPENIIISKDQAKIIDFNISKKKEIVYNPSYKNNIRMWTHIGTLEYSSPEVLQGYSEYTEQVDMWAAGLILYYILSGESAFKKENLKDTIDSILNAEVDFGNSKWENVSIEAKKLVLDLLTFDPKERASSSQALFNSWVKDTTTRKLVLNINPIDFNEEKINKTIQTAKHSTKRFRYTTVGKIQTTSHNCTYIKNSCITCKSILNHKERSNSVFPIKSKFNFDN